MSDPTVPPPAAMPEPTENRPPAEDYLPERSVPGRRIVLGGLALILAIAVVATLFMFTVRNSVADLAGLRLTDTQARDAVAAVIQRESADAFLVTGTLDVIASTTVRNTRTVLPGLLDLSLGTSSARVRVPGAIHYGIDLREFQTADVRVVSDSVVEVRMPAVRVQSVEPRLEELEVESERGWARLPGRSDREVERRAVELVTPVLRDQGAAHLADSDQPGINSARALARLLVPPLQAAGMERPVLRVLYAGRVLTVRARGALVGT